jgi:site-specific DNA recombinase
MANPKVRCAIYTRKSTEEGLDQTFNTLHAQREACEAYIQSQRHEGWAALPTLYDDGGFSGGSMGRPALQQLLDDIRTGKIDTVVVYKIDRLTRSLADFAKMVEVFDDPGGNGSIKPVSFVSVTQQFNTTTSMGRLTLNVLLSFAQFEREVIGERVRDKIAASKKKGMWMGGIVPLGYDVEDKMLVVNEIESETVRYIFRTYENVKSVHALKRTLDKNSIVSKVRINSAGKQSGGNLITRGALYTILRNHLYIAEISHNGKVFPGQHTAIIDQGLWDDVQSILNNNQVRTCTGIGCKNPSLLAGLLHDSEGQRLTPSHAVKKTSSGTKRYRYYVSRSLTTGTPTNKGLRIPANDIETIVLNRLHRFISNQALVHDEIRHLVTDAHDLKDLSPNAISLSNKLKQGKTEERRVVLNQVLKRIILRESEIELQVSITGLVNALGGKLDSLQEEDSKDETIHLTEKASLKRCGMEMKLIFGQASDEEHPDLALIKLISRSHRLIEQITLSENLSISDLARQEKVTPSYLSRLFRIATLTPSLTEKILNGQHPPDLTAAKLMRLPELPLSWKEQETSLNIY